MNDKIKIDISIEKERFKKHIDLQSNQRILFSGIFGSGKTYFLNDFFKDNKDYFCIKINPINYSVSNNQDIFDLMKYDIIEQIDALCNYELFDILKKQVEIDLGKENILAGKITNVTKSILNLKWLFKTTTQASELSMGVGNVVGGGLVNGLASLADEIKGKNDALTSGYDYASIAKKFYQEMKTKYPDQDHISMFIEAVINNIILIKEQSETIKKVLIIDDLDRIDPHHIFRIFNIFACQNNMEDDNKFGFDRVILCCDIENIRKIFSHFYGQNTDFSGYIDKFYSQEIFYYDTNDDLFDNLFKGLGLTDDFRNSMGLFLKPILKSKDLSIRSFIKKDITIDKINFEIENSPIRRTRKYYIVTNHISIRFLILLSKFFISANTFKECIAKYNINFYDDEELAKYILPEFLRFMLPENFEKQYLDEINHKTGEKKYKYELAGITYKFQIIESPERDNKKIINVTFLKSDENSLNTTKEVLNNSVKELTLKCIDILIENKLII